MSRGKKIDHKTYKVYYVNPVLTTMYAHTYFSGKVLVGSFVSETDAKNFVEEYYNPMARPFLTIESVSNA